MITTAAVDYLFLANSALSRPLLTYLDDDYNGANSYTKCNLLYLCSNNANKS